MLRRIAGAFLGSIVAFTAMQASAAVLVVSGPDLEGADGVLVEGQTFNVRFVDGVCSALFTGCDAASDFTFATEAAATAASQALLDQVFTPASGAFDDDPSLTKGCAGGATCGIITPYGVVPGVGDVVQMSVAENQPSPFSDNTALTTGGSDFDTTGREVRVFAIWTLVDDPPVSVPEPLALACVMIGALGGLAVHTRRRSPT